MHKHRNDFILIGTLLAVVLIVIICLQVFSKKEHLVAYIYHGNELVETIDLETLKEETTYQVEGDLGRVVFVADAKGIRVLEARCPDEICIHQGKITSTAGTITCLPNKVYVRLEGKGVDVAV